MRIWFVIYGMVLAQIIFAWRMDGTVPEWMPSAEIVVALACIAWFFPAEYVRGDGDSQRTSLIRRCPALWRIALHAFV